MTSTNSSFEDAEGSGSSKVFPLEYEGASKSSWKAPPAPVLTVVSSPLQDTSCDLVQLSTAYPALAFLQKNFSANMFARAGLLFSQTKLMTPGGMGTLGYASKFQPESAPRYFVFALAPRVEASRQT